MRFRSSVGEWVVDVIRLSLTSNNRDAEWFRVSRWGSHVADVRTVDELREYMDLAELEEDALARIVLRVTPTLPKRVQLSGGRAGEGRMGRIRKALSITSVIATGGVLGSPVKWESSAEKAARRHAQLLEQQNELLASLAKSTLPDEVSYFEQQAQELAATDVATEDIADPMLRSRVKRLRSR